MAEVQEVHRTQNHQLAMVRECQKIAVDLIEACHLFSNSKVLHKAGFFIIQPNKLILFTFYNKFRTFN